MRSLSIEDAETLEPGDDHYRAYVGPPGRFGLLTQLQLGLLFALGLEETDTVLDFGCGSLRLGRSLIPYLRPGCYFGLDPNLWLIDDGLAHETGEAIRAVKQPRFSGDANFDCTVFDTRFDFIMAQSVITHAGPAQTAALIESASKSLKQDGVLALSYIRGEESTPLPGADWTYPHNVAYPPAWLEETARQHGLVWRDISWFHPGAQWALLVRDETRLPDDATMGLHGRPTPRWRAGQSATS
ncbi:hypothetical protein GCM10011367_20930 [Marinicauda pacifica]|uniref:Class I SAM-dependent methyltransferase n=1 Tax=Marinicauda pacifica TaxID=1133559 RepID=A0A4V3RYY5_9PROT|nr:class I SAM-dependent methyltransferase [Marinicauda pacifica]TGY92099.1 hypothetical protein E5162_10550 [Marinicauda pacifica]GGE45957.1 hypothetical protein GCM10011367_20930 [Marinicauda pacifica]